jgi:hypothetical protein
VRILVFTLLSVRRIPKLYRGGHGDISGRYLAGDRIEVWNELVALGEAVRREKTMRRARYNIELSEI